LVKVVTLPYVTFNKSRVVSNSYKESNDLITAALYLKDTFKDSQNLGIAYPNLFSTKEILDILYKEDLDLVEDALILAS